MHKTSRFFAVLAVGVAMLTAATAAQAQMSAPTNKEIQDRLMIQDVMSRYEWALDGGDPEAYGALFTEDGVLINGRQQTKGRTAIVAMVRGLVERFRAAETPAAGASARPRAVIHSYSNVVIELNGNEAIARSHFIEVWNIRSGSPEIGSAGEYHDRFVKQNGKWYFASREIRGTMSSASATPRAPAGAAAPNPAAQLQKLEDIESIRTLLEHYIELNESRDYVAYSKLFAKDGELVLRRSSATGPEGILAMMTREFGGTSPNGALGRMSHILSNVKIEVTGDTATATSRWTMMTPTDDNKVRMGGTGRYGDKLVRENGTWKFQQRVVYRDIPADQPAATTGK